MKKGSIPERIEVKCGTLERVLRVSQQQISEYVKVGMPRPDHGRYDLEACVHWWVEQKQAEVASQMDRLDWKEQETRLKRFKANREELAFDLERGRLRPVADMEREYGQFVSNCRAKLLSISSTIAPRGIGCKTVAELKALIDGEVWDALSELSKRDETVQDTHTTAKTQRQRMGGHTSRPVARKRRRARKVAHRQG